MELGGASVDEARERGEALSRAPRRRRVWWAATCFPMRRSARRFGDCANPAWARARRARAFPRVWPGAEDFAVHPEQLGQYLRRFDQLLRRHNLTVNMYQGHFGEGCVHGRVAFDFSTGGH